MCRFHAYSSRLSFVHSIFEGHFAHFDTSMSSLMIISIRKLCNTLVIERNSWGKWWKIKLIYFDDFTETENAPADLSTRIVFKVPTKSKVVEEEGDNSAIRKEKTEKKPKKLKNTKLLSFGDEEDD